MTPELDAYWAHIVAVGQASLDSTRPWVTPKPGGQHGV